MLREKVESLRGKFDDMRMQEGENIVQYSNQIKELVNSIKVDGGTISEEFVVRKFIRILLLIYASRVSIM